MSKKRPRLAPGQRPAGDNGEGSWSVPDTPTSTRRLDEDVLLIGSTDDKGPLNKRGKFDEHKFSGSHRREDERQAHYRLDKAGAPCACDEKTACLAHAAISGRRRHVRPD